jgi:two-component system, OmpR family, sensor histidine kinase QseC
MKLFTRYFRINLLATLLIFLLASIAYYYLLWWIMIAQVDEDLKIEQREIEASVAKYHHLPEPVAVKDQRIVFGPAYNKVKSKKFSTVKSTDLQENEDFREISFTLAVGDQWYTARVSKSLEGTKELNRSVIFVSLTTLILILLVSLLINRWLVRRLWQPFYKTISGINKFQLGGKKIPEFSKSQIDEFNLLNNTLDLFIQSAEKEYKTLKEFTENASHELQTPLAIVRTKLDTLIQDEHLSEAQSNAAQTAYEAIQKMANLNQSLLLLSKIENRQFSETLLFDFKNSVNEKMVAWQELWDGKHLQVTTSLEPTLIRMNTQLADILLNNLFSNALRHSPEQGLIYILLHNNSFSISNTAYNGPLDAMKIFQRFAKGGQSSDHHGLGLSIVKQISEISGNPVSYHFNEGNHIFTISF